MNPLHRAYARQREISYRRWMHERNRQWAREVGWAVVVIGVAVFAVWAMRIV